MFVNRFFALVSGSMLRIMVVSLPGTLRPAGINASNLTEVQDEFQETTFHAEVANNEMLDMARVIGRGVSHLAIGSGYTFSTC